MVAVVRMVTPLRPALLAISLVLSTSNLAFGEHDLTPHRRVGGAGKLRAGARAPIHISPGDLHEQLEEAVSSVLGAGHGVSSSWLSGIRQQLSPLWKSLAKNGRGRIDRRSMRYAVHRYLLQKYSLSVVGLEPTQSNNSLSEAAILTDFAPAYVRNVLEGKAAGEGFSQEDIVGMVAALEQLVIDSNNKLLEESFSAGKQDVSATLDREQLRGVTEYFILHWMLGADVQDLEGEDAIEEWDQLKTYVHGVIATYEYSMNKAQARKSEESAFGSWTPLNQRFTFDDAQVIVKELTMNFGRFWEGECSRVKDVLVDMDKRKNGRVKMADFHMAALNGEWRFSESKEYLRSLGAIDESSLWYGPQVLITNYMQAPSNCIIATDHYRVCCKNDCEDHLRAIETHVGSSDADPETIFALLGNETLVASDGETPRLEASLKQQLQEIAQAHSGKVPLHGRLFAQWLHYVFPHDCPFPHKSGTTTPLSPTEFGDSYMATEDEIRAHAQHTENATLLQNYSFQDDWMSQWSQDEELIADRTHTTKSWQARFPMTWVALTGLGMLILMVSGGAYDRRQKMKDGSFHIPLTMASSKNHYC